MHRMDFVIYGEFTDEMGKLLLLEKILVKWLLQIIEFDQDLLNLTIP